MNFASVDLSYGYSKSGLARHCLCLPVSSFRFRWHGSARKGPSSLRPVSQRPPPPPPPPQLPHPLRRPQRLPSKQDYRWSGCTQIVRGPGGWNIGRFLSPLHFPSGSLCCDDLVCPRSEGSSSLSVLLLCQAVAQLCCLLCFPFCLPALFRWLWHGQRSLSSSSSSAFLSYISGLHHSGWDFRICDRFFFNPTIESATFRLCGWCMLDVILLPAFTRLGHEW